MPFYAVEEVAVLMRTVVYEADSKPEARERARHTDTPERAEPIEFHPASIRCRLATMRRISDEEADSEYEPGG